MKNLAPNGKPSNLTPEQYKLVRTPAFKKWFGDWENSPETASKVVDENGEPLVVYHGSPKFGFNQFLEKQGAKSKSKMQLLFGIHFASSKDDATLYAKEKGGVYDLFLNIKTPIDLSKGFVEKGDALFESYLMLSKELNLKRDFKFNLDYQMFTKEGDDGGKSSEVQRVFITQNMLDKYAPIKVYDALKNSGFDGVVYEPYQPQGFNTISKFSRSYIALYPTQIKLADGSNTTFNVSNPDIRFESGGKVNYYNNAEEQELRKIKAKYDADYNYFESEIYGQPYKIRMNKNHPRNTRNDDDLIHNLSLINIKYPTAKVVRENNGKLQWQYDEITDWEKAKDEIENFFYEIKDMLDYYKFGGSVNTDLYEKWKLLVNMSASELKQFMTTKDGKDAGLSAKEANEKGIDSGRESARWIIKMKDIPHSEWTPAMWKWAKKQISFISRMSGNKGGLYDDKGNKTRKHTSLLIWGHNPEKNKLQGGGNLSGNSKQDLMDIILFGLTFD